MNEAETCDELITPALRAAGWGAVTDSSIRREYKITKGRLQGGGSKTQALSADYVLVYRGRKLAVVEAKRRGAGVTDGLAQAKEYAKRLGVRFAYATNGSGVYQVDMKTGREGDIADLPAFPSPRELWQRTYPDPDDWRDRFCKVPFENRGGSREARYYQDNAVEAALSAIARGRDRILLTLATGTGKTAIAFQIAWTLFHSKWNLSRKPVRRPRILFLADRNILADQAYINFSAFPDDALARIKPAEIRKKGRVPKNASVFLTIFQTFMSGPEETPYFGEYPPDFFDFIVIDECHRGGARDESTWRGILEHFKPAVQLGLTATPKRKGNVDTYAYFGKPVYEYSLKSGINDGFLTPFRVRGLGSDIDEYTYSPDDHVVQGEIEPGRKYIERDFNTRRGLNIPERERHRVQQFMNEARRGDKTLVFCAGQDHAAQIRDIINQLKPEGTDPDYCVRVTADDGERGEEFLRKFQDNEKTIPTILTTSTKLSTGVDARNVRNIVLMRRVQSMIEFKQIIGRGTRLFDGKDHFTVYDFVKAHELFQDPEWDGESLEPVGGDDDPRTPPKGLSEDRPEDLPEDLNEDFGDDDEARQIIIKLADGKARKIRDIAVTTFFGPDGKPMTATQFIEQLFGELPDLFKDEDELRTLWGKPDTRKALIKTLSERGYGSDQLAEIRRIINAEKSDLFDVLACIRFQRTPVTRRQRAMSRRDDIVSPYDDGLAAFLDFVLGQYVKEGVGELDEEKLTGLVKARYYTIEDAANTLGSIQSIRNAFIDFQQHLYNE